MASPRSCLERAPVRTRPRTVPAEPLGPHRAWSTLHTPWPCSLLRRGHAVSRTRPHACASPLTDPHSLIPEPPDQTCVATPARHRARAAEPSPSPRSGRVALDARTLRSARVAFPMHRISIRAGPALASTPRNTDQPNHGVAMMRRASSSHLRSFRPRRALPSLRLCPEPKAAP